MSAQNANLLIVAGEPSGDLQASLLVRAFWKIAPDVHFWGIGGEKMRDAGVETVVDIGELAVMGLLDVVRHIPRLQATMSGLLHLAEMRKPRGAILVDYPGFNLSLAQKLKRRRFAVGYYISPQFWAWGERRIEKVRRFVDQMVCVLPFEKEFYARHGIEVAQVSHPFVDIVAPELDEPEFRKNAGIAGDFVLLMPGSRHKEVVRLLPKMLDVYDILREEHPDISAFIAAAEGVIGDIARLVPKSREIVVVAGLNYSAMRYAKAGIIASGSATLETLISNLPSVVVYRVDPLTWAIGRNLIRAPHIALANLVAGKRIFPEMIQNINVGELARIVEGLIYDDELRARMTNDSGLAREKLGCGGGAKDAADIFARLFACYAH